MRDLFKNGSNGVDYYDHHQQQPRYCFSSSSRIYSDSEYISSSNIIIIIIISSSSSRGLRGRTAGACIAKVARTQCSQESNCGQPVCDRSGIFLSSELVSCVTTYTCETYRIDMDVWGGFGKSL